MLEDFCYTVGYNDKGGSLLYLKTEKHLYTRKNKNPKNGKIYWACYDPIANNDGKTCGARCTVDERTGECWRNQAEHNGHGNHELIYRDLISLNSMKDHCRYLAKNFPISGHKIPIKEIYLAEMAKYVLLSLYSIYIIGEHFKIKCYLSDALLVNRTLN